MDPLPWHFLFINSLFQGVVKVALVDFFNYLTVSSCLRRNSLSFSLNLSLPLGFIPMDIFDFDESLEGRLEGYDRL